MNLRAVAAKSDYTFSAGTPTCQRSRNRGTSRIVLPTRFRNKEMQMARKVFFSFHYERDVWRSSIVRKSDTVKAEADERGFIDGAEWEKTQEVGRTRR